VSEEEFDVGLQLNEDDDVQLDEVDTPLFSFQLAPDDRDDTDNNDDNDSDNDDTDDVDVEHKYKLEIVQEDIDFVEGLVVNTRLCTRAPDEVLSAADAACSGEVMTKSVSTHSQHAHCAAHSKLYCSYCSSCWQFSLIDCSTEECSACVGVPIDPLCLCTCRCMYMS
jgi:hypothetical protein